MNAELMCSNALQADSFFLQEAVKDMVWCSCKMHALRLAIDTCSHQSMQDGLAMAH